MARIGGDVWANGRAAGGSGGKVAAGGEVFSIAACGGGASTSSTMVAGSIVGAGAGQARIRQASAP
ncbi:hypothetical protein A6A05_06600 [Magnetospirillum moscoviense]|uniref:Uncharacterized protein n=1 Tax=Magnetospirillum moscoviense TaxID=1437059 RepID=A0A178MYS1_9PROT|nr:hypothetical protein A6A05_06600 [Magnetospirillum moscoviense]